MYVPGASPEAQNANLRTVVDELRAHTSQLKKDLEAERSNIKDLRREKQTEVKSTRDQEQQKASLSLSELRAKLNHEKQSELATLRESLTKQHDQAINRLLKQKQELLARTQSDSQRDREMHYLKVKQQVWVEAKEEVKRTFEMDKGKLLAEIDELRRGKKKLEEELNDAVTGDRQRAIDLRKQWGEHQREMEQLQKDARRDIQRLVSTLYDTCFSLKPRFNVPLFEDNASAVYTLLMGVINQRPYFHYQLSFFCDLDSVLCLCLSSLKLLYATCLMLLNHWL